jgi:ribose transport system substrate-binding protein
MKIRSASVAVILGISIAACSSGTTDDGMGGADGDVETKEIDREEVPDGRFKPAALEESIDAMIAGIESTVAADEELSLGVVLKEVQGFWRPVQVGATRALGELEVVGSVKGSTETGLPVEESVPEQIGFVEEQLDLNVDGLAIAPHNDDLLPYMAEFTDADKPIVTIDSDAPDSDRDIFIGTDNSQGGKTGGETLVDILDGTTGRVLVLGNTDPSWTGGFDRTNEAAAVIEAAGNTVEILNSIWAPEDDVAQIAAAIADDSSGEPLVGMIGVFANAHTLATAAVDADLDEMPKIVAFDFEPDTLSYMESGVIAATHVQRQYYMGYLSVYVLYSIKMLGLEETKANLGANLLGGFHLDTGLDVIRAEDLEEYNAFIDDLGI